MASRKNTQGTKDSLEGASPEQAEVRSAAGADAGDQQQPGGGNEGDTGSPAGDPVAELARAVAAITPDVARIIPESTDIQILRRIATAADTIIHDGVHFAPGDPVPVTVVDFAGLAAAGVLAETAWGDLAEDEP